MTHPTDSPPPVEVPPASERRPFLRYPRFLSHPLLWKTVGGAAAAVLLVIAGLAIYASTPYFARSVRARIVSELADATGGRVEIQAFHWSLLHLSAQVDGLTIHGLEADGEAPYLHVGRVYVRARFLTLFIPRIGLSALEVDRPAFHLIIYPDGSTNQPRPRVRPKGNTDVLNTIFRLKVKRAEVRNGVALINQRAIPFDLSASNVAVVFAYRPSAHGTSGGRYLGHMEAADLIFKRGQHTAVPSKLTVELELERNAFRLKALHFSSGKSELDGSGSIADFANPHWNFATRGDVDLRAVAALTGIEGLRGGTAQISLQAQGDRTNPFVVFGKAQVTDAAYRAGALAVDGLSASTLLRITPTEIALDGIAARLRAGGVIHAVMHIDDWRKHGPASIDAAVEGIRLPTVMRMVAKPQFQDLGFDSAISGTVKVTWSGARFTGPKSNLAAAANLKLSAPASASSGLLSSGLLPMRGSIAATYFGREGAVQIRQFQAETPATEIQATGRLGVYPVTGASNLQMHLATDNLGEFDRLLKTLGLEVNGRRGAAAIPVHLSGEAEFTGTVTQSLLDPDVRGTLAARNFATIFHPSGSHATQIHWDSLNAAGEYSASRIVIQQATLVRGGAKIQVHGTIQPVGQGRTRRAGFREPEFGSSSPVNVTAGIDGASIADLSSIVGRQYPITGIVNLSAHLGGTLGDLDGGGDFSALGGAIEGEPYQSIEGNWSFEGRRINLTRLVLRKGSGIAIANGNYDLDSKKFLFNLDAKRFELAQFARLRNPQFPLAGELEFDAHASGTPQAPSLLIGVHLRNLTVRGQPEGGLEAFANTNNGVVSFSAHTTGKDRPGAIELSGQTTLRGDLPTRAALKFSSYDLEPFLETFHIEDLAGPTIVGGDFHASGSLKQPKLFQGAGEITELAVTRENVTLKNEGPILASLGDGVLHLKRAHIVGPDTDMSVAGTAALTGGQPLHIVGSGSINMALAQLFDPDITSTGHVRFNVEAGGTLRRPSMNGRVELADVSLALSDLPNGISRMNGTLEFDQDRLEVKNLDGKTGGGDLKIGGFITYQQGIYADLTATGKSIRVRYSGLSSTADLKLRLQGPERSLLLSGNILLTRFLVSPNIDFAQFTKPAAPSAPPNQNSPSSRVRLDIHVTSSPQLDFQNSYAQLAGSVDLRIRGTIAQPSVLGRINVTEGSAKFAGQNYRVQRGSISFTNPVHIEPLIDLDAITRIEEYDVTVGLHGSLNHLAPTFRSDPPLPQADVISLLALGRTQQEQLVYSQQQNQIGANNTANMLLGGALNATVSNRVQELFGFGSVKIDPNYLGNLGNSSARITVQQNISRTVQLTYARNVNATAEQLIQAQINLTRNISLVAIRDESDVFSLVVKFHKRAR